MTRLADSGLTADPALSDDGRFLAYASDRAGAGKLDMWVQPIGGEAVQVTRDPGDEREPAFSPDGTRLVFRSDQDGGGLFVMPTFGGSVRRIAREGWAPRFSPDGNWIAYGGARLFRSRLFIVAASGGVPRQLVADFAGAIDPVWTPDGRHIMFLGI